MTSWHIVISSNNYRSNICLLNLRWLAGGDRMHTDHPLMDGLPPAPPIGRGGRSRHVISAWLGGLAEPSASLSAGVASIWRKAALAAVHSFGERRVPACEQHRQERCAAGLTGPVRLHITVA